MKKIKLSDYLAIVSAAGILIWIGTAFYGGMIIFLISYWFLIFPIILLYIISFFQTLVALLKTGFAPNKIKIAAHLIPILVVIGLGLNNSDLFKSKRIVTATLKDDLFQYTLILREDGTCENKIFGMFGFTETFQGKYLLKHDTIIFTKVPYDNDFIPDTLLIDKKSNAIYMEKNNQGTFVREKNYLNHFIIHN